MHRIITPLSAVLVLGCSGPSLPRGAEPYVDLVAALAHAEGAATGPAGGPVAAADRTLLFLPPGAAAEYALYLAAESVLHADRIAVRGRTRLRIEIETDADGESTITSVGRSRRDLVLPLPLPDGTPVRLTLRAEGGDETGGIAIERPALWAPPPEPASAPSSESREPGRANVIVYLVDTLRRDRLGCYGYRRPISPNIDAFAAAATLFVNGIGQSSWTKASVASIFTGVWPPAHGATGWSHKLPPDTETLAEHLKIAGYRTAAFVTNPHVVAHFGFDQGFDRFERRLKTGSEVVNRMALEWLDQLGPGAPFLLYLHTMDPHAPYDPPEPFRQRFAPQANQMPSWRPRWRWPRSALPFLSALYDAEIAYNDHSFGELLAELKRRDLYDSSLILLVSDHGEEFKEHGRWRHGNNLHGESLNIPLIIKFPGQHDGRRTVLPAQHVDLMPTVLDVLGLPIPQAAEGRSLAGLETGNPAPAARAIGRVYSHLRLGRAPLSYSVVDGDWKLLRVEAGQRISVSLYNWRQDPGEERDLGRELPVRAAVLASLLRQKLVGLEPAEAPEAVLDEEFKRSLRALGYLP